MKNRRDVICDRQTDRACNIGKNSVSVMREYRGRVLNCVGGRSTIGERMMAHPRLIANDPCHACRNSVRNPYRSDLTAANDQRLGLRHRIGVNQQRSAVSALENFDDNILPLRTCFGHKLPYFICFTKCLQRPRHRNAGFSGWRTSRYSESVHLQPAKKGQYRRLL